MELSTGYNSAIVASVRSSSYQPVEGRLSIYNLKSGRHEAEHRVRYDNGGRRISLSRDTRICFVGCYKIHGLAAYSTLEGVEYWRRRDIKAIQRVSAFPFDDIVFCGREGAGQLICAKTGRTLETCRGIKAVYPSPFSAHALVSARTLDVHSQFGVRIAKIQRTTFAELNCCFSDAEVLICEAGGGVRCFDLASGELNWSHKPPKGSHYLDLCFSRQFGCFLGLCWRYLDGTDPEKRIVHFDRRNGAVLKEISIGTPPGHRFCLAGAYLFSTDLRLISVKDGAVTRKIEQGPADNTHTGDEL